MFSRDADGMSSIEPAPTSTAPEAAALPPGFYPDGQGATRWWDGRGWTEHLQQELLPAEQRAERLNTAVAGWVRGGWSVEFNDGQQAVLIRVKRMGWFLNTVLVFVTFGVWLIYVIYRALNRKVIRRVLMVDANGGVQVR